MADILSQPHWVNQAPGPNYYIIIFVAIIDFMPCFVDRMTLFKIANDVLWNCDKNTCNLINSFKYHQWMNYSI